MAQGIVLSNKSVDGSVGDTNPLPVRIKDGVTGDDWTSGHKAVGDFRKEVAIPGTAVQLDDNTCKRCIVQALSDNTNPIEVGGANVVAATATQRGLGLQPGQAQTFDISNTNLLWVDALTAGEGVSVIYEN